MKALRDQDDASEAPLTRGVGGLHQRSSPATRGHLFVQSLTHRPTCWLSGAAVLPMSLNLSHRMLRVGSPIVDACCLRLATAARLAFIVLRIRRERDTSSELRIGNRQL